MTETGIAWLAGWLEGEGCFAIMKQKNCHSLRIQAMSTDHDVVLKVERLAGGYVNGPYARTDRKPYWIWTIANRGACVDLLEALLPHMGSRRAEKIGEMFEMHRKHPSRKRRKVRPTVDKM